MSMQETKNQLMRLLEDKDNKVLALSGKWGTGKTHMWRQVKEGSSDEAVKNALYVSLFGLAQMGQIKLKIVQSALPLDNKKSWSAAANTAVGGAKKILVSLHQGFSALDELALLAVPALLKNKVIVLDDIERKHPDLSIDEVLGFIDEFTQLHGARFVIVLNSDQLKDKEVWSILREKVVDQELRLDTTSSEAMDVALGLSPSPFGPEIRKAVEVCRVTNIRVLRKIIKATNQVLGSHKELPAEILARTVPSIALLSAIHFRGIEDGPDFGYVLRSGQPMLDLQDDAEEPEKSLQRKHAAWDLMLSELGIIVSDDFELVLVEFLQSGYSMWGVLDAIIQRYLAEQEVQSARAELRGFHDRIIWDHRLSDADLLVQANALLAKVEFLDASSVSTLARDVASLAGGADLSERIINQWVENAPDDFCPNPDHEFYFQGDFHPKIQRLLEDRGQQAQAQVSVLDACMYLFEHNGWGARQEMALQSASVEDFESTIRAIEPQELRRFMRKMLDLCVHRTAYLTHFGSAMDRFAEACRKIVAGDPESRLAQLIVSLFKSFKIEHELAE